MQWKELKTMSITSPKYRNYFITINQGAESYENALEIVKDLNTSLYALIVHDKDEELDDEGVFIPKKVHKHLCVELRNAITFQSMQKKFVGAHIEVMKYRKASYQYLVHNRPNAKEKYQYDTSAIISNNLDSVKDIINAEEGAREFSEYDFIRYIAEGITTAFQFAKIFGLRVYKEYWRAYWEMISLSEHDIEMIKAINDMRKTIMEEQEEELPF